MIGLSVPRWLDALVGIQVGFGLALGWVVFIGWAIYRIGGPWVDKAEARLARAQAGGEQYGWRPGTDTDGQLATAGSRCFGHNGDLHRMMVGEYEGRPIRIAEFRYLERAQLPTTSTNHLIAIELPVELPELVVSRETLLDPMFRFDTESEAFNRRYFVACDDQRFCSAVVHPRMMEWLLAHELSFRISGRLLVAYAAKSWTVRQTLATLPVLSGVAGLIPRFVFDDFSQATR